MTLKLPKLVDSLPDDIVAEIVECWYQVEREDDQAKKEVDKIIKNFH